MTASTQALRSAIASLKGTTTVTMRVSQVTALIAETEALEAIAGARVFARSEADLIEAMAKAIWTNRETTFPGFTRLSWDQGTELARTCARADARAAFEVVKGIRA